MTRSTAKEAVKLTSAPMTKPSFADAESVDVSLLGKRHGTLVQQDKLVNRGISNFANMATAPMTKADPEAKDT